MALAAGMDARGYGRVGALGRGRRTTTGALLLLGLCGICVGSYALLDQTAPRWLVAGGLGLGVLLAARRAVVGRPARAPHPLPPRPVARAEVVVALTGVAVAWALRDLVPLRVLTPALDAAPTVTTTALLVVLAGLLAAVAAPPPRCRTTTTGRPPRRGATPTGPAGPTGGR